MDEFERIELSAVLDFFAAAPPDVADAVNLAVFQLGGPAAFSIGAYPNMLLFNRVLGLEGAVPVEGGIPLLIEGRIAGAIGLSGGTSPQDGQCAQAGVDALK